MAEPMKLKPDHVKLHVTRLSGELGTSDHARVAKLASLLDSETNQVSVADALAQLYPESRSLESQNKRLTELRHRFNDLAETAGQTIQLQTTVARSVGAGKRFLWFEGEPLLEVTHTTDELTRVQSNLITERRGLPLTEEPRLLLAERRDGKPLVRWFVSYAHAGKLASDLMHRLDKQLRNNKHYSFELWSDHQILVSQDWHGEIQRELCRSHLGFLFLSHDFLASEYIRKHELPVFVSGRAENGPGKRAVPVALEAIDFNNTELKGLDERQIYLDPDGKAYAERRGAKQEEWVTKLVDKVCKLLDRYADVGLPTPTAATPVSAAPRVPKRQGPSARLMLSQDLECLPHVLDVRGRLATLT
jgi:TIR domain